MRDRTVRGIAEQKLCNAPLSIGGTVCGVDSDSPVQQLGSIFQRGSLAHIDLLFGLQVKVKRVDCAARGCDLDITLIASQTDLELAQDSFRDLILNGEYVRKLVVISI